MTFSKLIKSVAAMILALSMLSFSNFTLADETIASGKFKGASGHATSGSVSIVKTSSGLQVVLGDDFKFDGAPDAKVGFGKNGKYDGKSQLDILRSNNGQQTYAVPTSLNIEGYDEVYIWCKQYNVSLGVAKIK
jgi:hypothetical protein